MALEGEHSRMYFTARSIGNELYDEELFVLYSSPNIMCLIKSRKLKWEGHVARMGERVAYKVLVGKPVGRRQLKKSRGTLEDIIQMGLLELGQVRDRDRRRAVVYMVM